MSKDSTHHRNEYRKLKSKDIKNIIFPQSDGKFIKTPDTLRMSPRKFLRIGKVQKGKEEPLTVA